MDLICGIRDFLLLSFYLPTSQKTKTFPIDLIWITKLLLLSSCMIHPWAMYYPTASSHVGNSEMNAADVAYQYHTLYADGDSTPTNSHT